MAKLPISACIIAKNEEKYIEECLKRLKPLGMEIVVVDTGSTDATREIALKYTSKVYDFEWINDFSAARNFAAQKAVNSWILQVDCDEYVTYFNAKKLTPYLVQFPRSVGTLDMVTVRTQPDGEKTHSTETLARLYNKKYYEFRFRIHEQITPKSAADNGNITIYSFKMPVSLEHHGYDISKEEIAKKQERNLSMLQLSLGEVPGHDDYLYYQIGQSYTVLERYDDAREAYKKCFDSNNDAKKSFIPEALLSYARVLMKIGPDVETISDLYITYNKYRTVLNCCEHFYYLAFSFEKAGQTEEALKAYASLVRMPDIDTLGDKVYEAYISIIRLCAQRGDVAAQSHFAQMLKDYGVAHGKEITFS